MDALTRHQNPKVEGSDTAYTTLYYPDADAEVPVVVGYDTEGYKQVCIQSVHHDFGRGQWGRDVYKELDEDQLADLAANICLQLPWNGKACRDERNLPGYAPRAGGL